MSQPEANSIELSERGKAFKIESSFREIDGLHLISSQIEARPHTDRVIVILFGVFAFIHRGVEWECIYELLIHTLQIRRLKTTFVRSEVGQNFIFLFCCVP